MDYEYLKKDINLKLVTPDLSKVSVIQSNWDALKLFDNVEHNINYNSLPYTENAVIGAPNIN